MIYEERSTRDNCGCSSLPPSLTKRNTVARNHTNAVLMKKRSNDKQQPILTTCLSSSSSYSSLSTLKAIKNSKDNNSNDKKRVVFNELVKVVLIPSRQEYKLRGLELMLWWNPTDYFQFQQEARSEITLCATFENISFTQARTKLYQPDPMEMDPYNSKLTKSQSIAEMSLQAIDDDDDYYSASVETSPINTQYSRHHNGSSNSNDSSDSSNNSTDNDTSDDSDEDKDNNGSNIKSGRIRFYQHSPKPSQASLVLVNSNKGNSSPPSSSSSALRILSKRMSANALDTYHEDDDIVSDNDDDCNETCNNRDSSSAGGGGDRNMNGEITVAATAIAKYSLTKSTSAPALLSSVHTTTTNNTNTANNTKNHKLVQPQHESSVSPQQQPQPIDDLHICVLSSEFQSLTSSSTYPDTYLERLRKRNLETFTGIDFTINTPSLTACSVFALTVVAVVARFF